MRLLHIVEGDSGLDISFEEYVVDIPPYAILSHRWIRPQDEVSNLDLVTDPAAARSKAGFSKILYCCRQAIEDGFHYAWVDTCCLNSSSSAELSEAINSMYTWYAQAEVCYVYLADVDESELVSPLDSRLYLQFRQSDWHTRGWTLQELIAPKTVHFFTREWMKLGTKAELVPVIEEVTRVPKDVLLAGSVALVEVCIAQKMSWAAGRKTTRVEDRAYSLLGILGVSIPILYGGGMDAFQRLQERLIQVSADHSIFAWRSKYARSGMLAGSPDAFEHSHSIRRMNGVRYGKYFVTGPDSRPDYSLTNVGLSIGLSTYLAPGTTDIRVAFLSCLTVERELVWVYLLRDSSKADNHFVRLHPVNFSLGTGSSADLAIGGHNYVPDYRANLWIADMESRMHFGIYHLPPPEPYWIELIYDWSIDPAGVVPRPYASYPTDAAALTKKRLVDVKCADGQHVVVKFDHMDFYVVVGIRMSSPWVDLLRESPEFSSCQAVHELCTAKPDQMVCSLPALRKGVDRIILLHEDHWLKSPPSERLDYAFFVGESEQRPQFSSRYILRSRSRFDDYLRRARRSRR